MEKSLFSAIFLFSTAKTQQKKGATTMSQLTIRLSQYWSKIQGTLFPWLEEELDPLTKKQQQLITILELVREASDLSRPEGDRQDIRLFKKKGYGRSCPKTPVFCVSFVIASVF